MTESKSKALEHFRWLYTADVRSLDSLRERWHEDAVIIQDPTMPGTRGEFRGYEGIQALDRELHDSFDEIAWEPREIRDLGEDRYVVLLLAHGRGKESGVSFPDGVPIGHIVWLRDGRFARMETHVGWEPALRAAGLDPE